MKMKTSFIAVVFFILVLTIPALSQQIYGPGENYGATIANPSGSAIYQSALEVTLHTDPANCVDFGFGIKSKTDVKIMSLAREICGRPGGFKNKDGTTQQYLSSNTTVAIGTTGNVVPVLIIKPGFSLKTEMKTQVK